MRHKFMLAGLAGGLAEILWVLAYSAVAPLEAAGVAREVTASIVPGAAGLAAAPALGVAIHLGLSIALAYAFVAALERALPGAQRGAQTVAIAVAALVGVWAFNFLLLMPLLGMRFVTLMPYAATLFSKALFGAVMGSVLARPAPPRVPRR
jgi:hypothetical protein